ncbi:MAG: glycoside hydrolase, partial [Kiritimatiellae bacterium]|nr:glycoside hydrolase [Kiritimatiellia bacterium]
TQVLKRDGWYYLVNIGWPRGNCRTVFVHRSRTMRGPWEGKIVFQREGIAQGSFIDDAQGNWYGYFFGDRGAVGRCPYVLPVTWQDGWPVIEPRSLQTTAKGTKPGIVASDDFSSSTLARVWQWNHNPVPALWSLTARPGWMRLTTDRLDADLLTARNTLTQRCWGPTCCGITKIDTTGMKPGDWAGLALFQKEYGMIGIGKQANGRLFVEVKGTGVRPGQGGRVDLKRETKVVYLKAVGDFTRPARENFVGNPPGRDEGCFFYSEDGVAWSPLGRAFKMRYTIPHFTGYRFALFYYATETAGGSADFDYLKLD